MVKAAAGGAVLVAAALPMAAAGVASAATSPTIYSTAGGTTSAATGSPVVQQNGANLINLVGANFAFDGGPVTISTNAPGVTVSGATETGTTAANATFTASATTAPGFYSVTLTDDNGTVTLPNALGVIAGPQITSTTPSSLVSEAIQTIALTGTGFKSTQGTAVTVAVTNPAGGTVSSNGTYPAAPGTGGYNYSINSGTSAYLQVNTNGLAAGTYTVTLTDESSVTAPSADFASVSTTFTIVGTTITNVNPNGIPVNASTPITITGTGFNSGAQVSFPTCTGSAAATAGIAVVNSSTSISVLVATGATNVGTCDVKVLNTNGTTFTATNALGVGTFGAPIVASAGSASVTGTLAYGNNVVTVSTTGFALTTGATVTLYNSSLSTNATGPLFNLTGTVVSVSGGTAQVAVYVPRFATTTLATAVAAGATPSVYLTSTTGVTSPLTFVDGANSEFATFATLGTPTVLTSALANGHAAGVTVEFPFPVGSYVMNLNTGSTTVQTTTSVGTYSNDLQSAVIPGSLSLTGPTVGTGQTVPMQLSVPGLTLGTGSTLSLVAQSGGSMGSSQGITATITPDGNNTATAKVTIPASIPGKAVLQADVLQGANQITLLNADAAKLSVGSAVTLTTVGGYAQTFTVTAIGTPAGGVTVVYFGTIALTTFPAATSPVTSSSFSATVASGPYTAIITNGTGQLLFFSSFLTVSSTSLTISSINVANATDLATYNANGSITSIGTVAGVPSIGAGAVKVPMIITGSSLTTAPSTYTVTSNTPGVTFSGTQPVCTSASGTTCNATSATQILTYVSVAAGTAPVASVSFSVSTYAQGGATLPASATSPAVLSTVVAPTITSVSLTSSSFSAGNGGTLTINGTGFTSGTAVTIVPATGNNAGSADIGAAGQGNGVSCTAVGVGTSGSITCSLVVGGGATPGTDSIVVTAGGNFGEATYANGPVITGPSVSTVTPNAIDPSYAGSFVAALNGLTVTPSTLPTAQVYSYNPVSGAYTLLNHTVTVTYNTASSVTLTPTTPSDYASLSGYSLVFVVTSGLNYMATPMIMIGGASITSAGVSPNVQIAPGTSATVTVYDTTNGANAFQPTTALYYSGTGVTFSALTVVPNALTVTITAASTATSGTFSVGTGGVGSFAVQGLTLGNGPTISSPSVLVPFSAPAGKATTLTITGTGFQLGAVVSASTAMATFGTAVLSNYDTVGGYFTTITVPVTFVTFSGATPVSANLIVTNPGSGGSTSVTGALVANPGPVVTGTYYVPTFSTNVQTVISGTGFQAGMTASSTGSGYTVILGGVTPTTATLLVTTDSTATTGTSAKVTFTNPDGGTVTFPLNGGPVPATTSPLSITGVSSFGKAGTTRAFNINGTGFVSGVSISSGKAGISFKVMGVSANSVRVQVTVAKGVAAGWSRLVFTNGDGRMTTKPYQHK